MCYLGRLFLYGGFNKVVKNGLENVLVDIKGVKKMLKLKIVGKDGSEKACSFEGDERASLYTPANILTVTELCLIPTEREGTAWRALRTA